MTNKTFKCFHCDKPEQRQLCIYQCDWKIRGTRRRSPLRVCDTLKQLKTQIPRNMLSANPWTGCSGNAKYGNLVRLLDCWDFTSEKLPTELFSAELSIPGPIRELIINGRYWQCYQIWTVFPHKRKVKSGDQSSPDRFWQEFNTAARKDARQ